MVVRSITPWDGEKTEADNRRDDAVHQKIVAVRNRAPAAPPAGGEDAPLVAVVTVTSGEIGAVTVCVVVVTGADA